MDHSCLCSARARSVAIALGIVGAGAFLVGLATAPARAWAGLLVGNYFVLSMVMGAALFVALNQVFGSGWASMLKRVPEAMTAYLPIGGGILLLTFLIGGPSLYPWMRPEVVAQNPHLQHKQALLNPTAYIIATLVAFGLWIGYARLMRARSTAQDRDGDIRHTYASRRLSAGFLVLSGLAVVAVSFLWLMSLEPLWTSTMYPGYVYASMLAAAAVGMALLVLQLGQKGILPGVSETHVYELGRLVAATCTLWVYIWFSEYMLIYYTNIPEEAIHFAVRRTGPFAILFILNIVLNWVGPMLMFLTERSRHSADMLRRVCIMVLIGRLLDAALLILPAIETPIRLTYVDVLTPLLFVPIFMSAFWNAFRRSNPVGEHDPYLVEGRGLAVH